jgi:hypothetical protein
LHFGRPQGFRRGRLLGEHGDGGHDVDHDDDDRRAVGE